MVFLIKSKQHAGKGGGITADAMMPPLFPACLNWLYLLEYYRIFQVFCLNHNIWIGCLHTGSLAFLRS